MSSMTKPDPGQTGHQQGGAAPGIGPHPPLDLVSLGSCFDEFPDPIVIVNADRRIVYLNHSAEQFLGCLASDLQQQSPSCSDILHTEPGPDHCFVERCLDRNENLNRLPVRLQNRYGDRFRLSVTATIIKDHEGRPRGCFAMLRDIHADLMAEPEIRDQLATLTSILDHFPMPFFTVDPNLVITYMNKPLEQISGYRREEVVGRMSCAQVLCTDQCDTNDCLLRRSMRNLQPISGVRRMIRDRSGREIPVVVNSSIITDAGGNVVGGFEAFRDITRIIEAEKKIELLTEMTREAILMMDESQKIVFANSRMAEITGHSKEELVGLDASEILVPQHLSMIRDLVNSLGEERDRQMSFCSTLPMTNRADLSQHTFETCIAASRVGKSVITYIYFHDLTGRIEIERQLRKTNSFLTNIIQSSVDGIVVIDTEGNVLIFNEGAERILGFNAEEVIGRPGAFRRFYNLEQAREMMQRMRSDRYGPPGKLETTRITFLNKAGEEVPVNFSAAIIREGEKELGSVGIFTDLREHLRVRRELVEAQTQLVQAEKIASLGRMSAGVAHEINNPLAGILIYADMLLKEVRDHPRWEQDLQEIVNQTLRCKEIVARLLEFSRQSLGERVVFNVNEIITRCVRLLVKQSLFHDIEIVEDLAPELPQIQGDPGQLQQVFINLILNAADALEAKGRLGVSSRWDRETQRVVLEFCDNGRGMAPDVLDKIFEPFYTTKPPGKGTGLGLSIAYGVIQRHGGSLEVASESGVGTTFTIELPLESPEEPDAMMNDQCF